LQIIETGKGRQVRKGSDVAIISIGSIGNEALEACEKLSKQNIEAALFDLRFVKPLDESLLHIVFQNFDKVITVEDGCVQGGMGSAVLEFMADNGYSARVKRLGIPDKFIEHGEQKELWQECGFDTNAIVETVKEMVAKKNQSLVG
jgi:1-deoxy-D-xylulose-5-phosphate synthase